MSTRIVHRPARSAPGAPPVTEKEVERPPQLPEDDGAGNLLMLVPMLGAGASMTVRMLFRGSGLAAVGALMMILTVIAFVVMTFSQRGKAARRRRLLRERYLAYLDRTGAELGEAERGRAASASAADPHPGALLALTRDPRRLWERRRDDEDFLRLRIGTGAADAVRFHRTGDTGTLAVEDEFMAGELDRVERRYATLPQAPVTLDVLGHVSIVGDPDFCRRVATLLTCQAAASTSPEDLQISLLVPPERRSTWDWLTWLPHLADQERATAVGPVRRIAPDAESLAALLRPELHRRLTAAAELRRHLRGNRLSRVAARMWVVQDTHGSPAADLPLGDREITAADLAVTVLHLLERREHEPHDIALRLSPDPARAGGVLIERVERRDRAPQVARAVLDELRGGEAEALARRLAGLRLSPDSLEHSDTAQVTRAADLPGVGDLTAIDTADTWTPRPRSSFLRVQIGVDDAGDPVMLDLKESAQFGMGPHGLAIGATGSGKSELLRTLVLGLCVGHSRDDVNLVLVDYKGGAAFAPFATLPHVAGVITNLGDDAHLVERVHASLTGEIQRRQQVLKEAGNPPDITAYRRLRAQEAAAGRAMEPLAHLVVVIDEFGELLTARPDFIDLFLSIGRIGRSIGVHLLLSSQRIEGGKLRGLDTYLSYRIGLRTLSEAESRTVLDTPDAFTLPPLPGFGYLKVDTTTYTCFRAGYVSGSLPAPEDDEPPADTGPRVRLIEDYAPDPRDPEGAGTPGGGAGGGPGGGPDGWPRDEEGAPEGAPEPATVLSTVVDQLAAHPRTTRPIWLAPLPAAFTLRDLVGVPAPTRRGLRVQRHAPMHAPVGILDDPARQRQSIELLDLAADHVLIVGAPRTGRTTALATIAAAAALTHAPQECVIYGLDLTGAALTGIRGLPNMAGVAGRMEREAVRRTVEEVLGAMDDRESLLARHRLPDLATARARLGEAGTGGGTAAGTVPWTAADVAQMVVLIDGIGQLGEEFAELEDPLRDVVRRGGGLGVTVVATATRYSEVRLAMQSYFARRFELRLTDPGESAVGRKLAETLAADRPGRYLTGQGAGGQGLVGQFALPRIDADRRPETAAVGLAALVRDAAAAAPEGAPAVRVLPAVVRPADVAVDAARATQAVAVPLGLRERDLGVEFLDPDAIDRNVVVLGDNGTGRTALLRHLALALTARYTPEELVFAVFDPRRTLHGVIPEPYLGGYAASAALVERLVAAIPPELRTREPDAVDGTVPETVHQPRIVILADDYDVLTAAGTSPLAPLQPYLAMSRELNLSAVLARRVAGAARGLHDPVLATVREGGATGLMFSGDRGEGPLLGGVRAERLPAGRALLVRAGRPPQTVQVVFDEGAPEGIGGVGFGGRQETVRA